jgi:hypothetical protein
MVDSQRVERRCFWRWNHLELLVTGGEPVTGHLWSENGDTPSYVYFSF